MSLRPRYFEAPWSRYHQAGSLADRAQLFCFREAAATRAAGESCLPLKVLYSSATCMASSRVGTSTRAAIPGVLC